MQLHNGWDGYSRSEDPKQPALTRQSPTTRSVLPKMPIKPIWWNHARETSNKWSLNGNLPIWTSHHLSWRWQMQHRIPQEYSSSPPLRGFQQTGTTLVPSSGEGSSLEKGGAFIFLDTFILPLLKPAQHQASPGSTQGKVFFSQKASLSLVPKVWDKSFKKSPQWCTVSHEGGNLARVR